MSANDPTARVIASARRCVAMYDCECGCGCDCKAVYETWAEPPYLCPACFCHRQSAPAVGQEPLREIDYPSPEPSREYSEWQLRELLTRSPIYCCKHPFMFHDAVKWAIRRIQKLEKESATPREAVPFECPVCEDGKLYAICPRCGLHGRKEPADAQ